jgi:hypothetical protein
MSLDALSMPHAWERSCAWSLGRGGGGGPPPAHAPLDLRDLFPASDRRPEIARALTRAQPSCSAAHPRSGRDRASPTRRWQPRAWQPGRPRVPLRTPGRRTHFRPPPEQRPQPAPAPPRQAVRRRVRPRAREWRWRTPSGAGAGAGALSVILWPIHGRPKIFVFIAHGFRFLMVFGTTVGPKLPWTVEAKRVYGTWPRSFYS